MSGLACFNMKDELKSTPSIEFIRLFFNSPKEEQFAVRCAEFLAGMVGDRIMQLRPETTWAEIFQWRGSSLLHSAMFALALKEKFGTDVDEIMANPEFMTFREFVEYVCSRDVKNRGNKN